MSGRVDAQLFSQIMNSLEQKEGFRNAHVEVKEILDCLEELYLGTNNLNMAYDVVQELFRGKRGISPFYSIMQTSR